MTFETLTKASEAEEQVTNFSILATLCLIVIGVFVVAETLNNGGSRRQLMAGIALGAFGVVGLVLAQRISMFSQEQAIAALSEDHDNIELINGDLYRVADAEHCLQEDVADRLDVVEEPNRLYFVVYTSDADSETCVPSPEVLGLESD